MMPIFVLVKPCILSVALNLSFQSTMSSATEATAAAAAELSAVAQAEGKLKVDPSIGIADMQAVVEAYLKAEGSRNFQALLDVIAKEGTSWTARPKVCLFETKVCEAFC